MQWKLVLLVCFGDPDGDGRCTVVVEARSYRADALAGLDPLVWLPSRLFDQLNDGSSNRQEKVVIRAAHLT